MIWVFAVVTVVLCVCALVDEVRPGGSLFPGFDNYYDADVLELPLADGWDETAVLTTLAEISSL